MWSTEVPHFSNHTEGRHKQWHTAKPKPVTQTTTTKEWKKGQDNHQRQIEFYCHKQQNRSTLKRVHPKHVINEMVERTNYSSHWSVAALLKITRAYRLWLQTNSKLIQQQSCQGTHKNVLFNVGAVKKEEGEHTNSTLYDNWKCTNANKLCG